MKMSPLIHQDLLDGFLSKIEITFGARDGEYTIRTFDKDGHIWSAEGGPTLDLAIERLNELHSYIAERHHLSKTLKENRCDEA